MEVLTCSGPRAGYWKDSLSW